MPEGQAFGPSSAARKQPRPQRRIVVAFAVAGAVSLAIFMAIFTINDNPETQTARTLSGAAIAIAVALGLAWLALDQFVIRPARRLAAEARLIAEAKSDAPMDIRAYRSLGPLPESVELLAGRLIAAQREIEQSVAAATRRVEEQKERLEAILRDLSEGVMVCNLDHQVLLYNQVALSLLHVAGELGLGRSIFQLVTREPVLHALQRLTQRLDLERPGDEATIALVCATVDSRTLLSGRMSLVVDAAQQPTGYVLTFTDATRSIAELSRRDTLLRRATEGLRQPIANLRAAAETMSAYPSMSANERRAFEHVILREGDALSERLEALDRDYRGLSAAHWPMADIHSLDLFNCVVRDLHEAGGPKVTMVGLPLWLHGDSHSLVLALERILRNLATTTGADSFDIEALLGDKRVYIEIAWQGSPLASATLDSWGSESLPGALGLATLRDVLNRHGSEMWSRAEASDRAILRIPLPAPTRLQFAPAQRPALPPRPEFYDFELLRAPRAPVSTQPLKSVSYVVFDTETTGLRPSEGDEIISIGAVRIVNGRILTGETFSRLINPRRSIPSESIQYHHITDAMVADAPPAEVVLPQFKAFAADSPLVAHNAAFDLKFLKLKEEQCGVRFDNLPLDTLLIAAFLFPEFADHSLDALADRLGIGISGRHTALGDAMATAAVFARLLDLLEARNITTLSALMEASKMTLAIRAGQAQF
ncbi:MAG TPA: exonuclease domain-containing protein [Alphaproteobacteria bacterium]|nr:exonuclease domain-containing protein [Alphaproteobacteria bacterium]